MRRPWRKVVMAEAFEQTPWTPYGVPKKSAVKMNRLMLECGHYVDEKRFRFGSHSKKVRCHVCQSSGVFKADIA